MGGGPAPVPGAVAALVVFLPIIRKQHETDLQLTQKRLKIYLKCIDKQSFMCYLIIGNRQEITQIRLNGGKNNV